MKRLAIFSAPIVFSAPLIASIMLEAQPGLAQCCMFLDTYGVYGPRCNYWELCSNKKPVSSPGSTPNTSPPSPQASPGSRPQKMPQVSWQGTAIQNGYGSYPMIMYMERRSGAAFSGKLHWTTLRNSITSMDGKFVTDFGEGLERSKWKYVKGFGVAKNGAWLTFTERELLQGGGILLGVTYYAHLKEDGTIQGVWFDSDRDSKPGGNFEINLRK